VRNAVNELDIKLLICLTETGSTLRYLSGYDFGCPILAVCSDYRVARYLVAFKSVFTVPVGSLVGYESVIAK
jgi:pyruvate kinase